MRGKAGSRSRSLLLGERALGKFGGALPGQKLGYQMVGEVEESE